MQLQLFSMQVLPDLKWVLASYWLLKKILLKEFMKLLNSALLFLNKPVV